MTGSRLFSSLLLLVALAPASLAGAPDAIVTLVKNGVASPNPIPAVFQGLAALPDTDLDGATVADALEQGGVPPGSVLATLLGGITELKKTGNTIEIKRPSAVTLPVVVGGKTQGYMGLDKDVTAKIKAKGSNVTVDDMDGASVGSSADSLYDMSSLVYADGPSPTLTIEASLLFLSKSVVIPLKAPAAAPAAASADPGLPLPSPSSPGAAAPPLPAAAAPLAPADLAGASADEPGTPPSATPGLIGGIAR
jgi:hypothetical protein